MGLGLRRLRGYNSQLEQPSTIPFTGPKRGHSVHVGIQVLQCLSNDLLVHPRSFLLLLQGLQGAVVHERW